MHRLGTANKENTGGYLFCGLFGLFMSFRVCSLLWSPAWKGLTSWLSFVMINCVFVTFPCGILDQVWYLIVSIPDLCHFSYFKHVKRYQP